MHHHTYAPHTSCVLIEQSNFWLCLCLPAYICMGIMTFHVNQWLCLCCAAPLRLRPLSLSARDVVLGYPRLGRQRCGWGRQGHQEGRSKLGLQRCGLGRHGHREGRSKLGLQRQWQGHRDGHREGRSNWGVLPWLELQRCGLGRQLQWQGTRKGGSTGEYSHGWYPYAVAPPPPTVVPPGYGKGFQPSGLDFSQPSGLGGCA